MVRGVGRRARGRVATRCSRRRASPRGPSTRPGEPAWPGVAARRRAQAPRRAALVAARSEPRRAIARPDPLAVDRASRAGAHTGGAGRSCRGRARDGRRAGRGDRARVGASGAAARTPGGDPCSGGAALRAAPGTRAGAADDRHPVGSASRISGTDRRPRRAGTDGARLHRPHRRTGQPPGPATAGRLRTAPASRARPRGLPGRRSGPVSSPYTLAAVTAVLPHASRPSRSRRPACLRAWVA